MKRVGRDAVLDETSVQEADQRQADWNRPRTRAPRGPSSPLTVIRVDPEVWEAALRLADGEASRIQVHSDTNVTVHNRPWHLIRKARA
jgi:hypothetical protein